MDCVFCNIAKGFERASIRHQDDEFVAFDDLYPKAETHVLVIPRTHHENLDAWLDAGGSGDRILGFVTETAAAAGLSGRYRLLTNVGRDAGQLIFHLHWHVMAGGLRAF